MPHERPFGAAMGRRLPAVQAGQHNLLRGGREGGRWIEDGGIGAEVPPHKQEAVEVTGAAKKDLICLVTSCHAGVVQELCARAGQPEDAIKKQLKQMTKTAELAQKKALKAAADAERQSKKKAADVIGLRSYAVAMPAPRHRRHLTQAKNTERARETSQNIQIKQAAGGALSKDATQTPILL